MAFKTGKSLVGNIDQLQFVGRDSYDSVTLPNNQTKINASDGASNDYFGWSVGAGSGRVVIGAPFDDDNGTSSGSAYVFDPSGNFINKIVPAGSLLNDGVGYVVAAGCDRIVLGIGTGGLGGRALKVYVRDLDGNQISDLQVTGAIGGSSQFGSSVAVGSGRIVVGDPHDNEGTSGDGSAYIFDLDGNLVTKIYANDRASGDRFGHSVAVGSGRVVVGSQHDDDNGSDSGSVYIFDLDGNQLAKITAADGAAGDGFGSAVAVGAGRIVVGSPGDNSSTGAVYVFDLNGTQLAKIIEPSSSSWRYFGFSVAVGSGRIVVGRSDDLGGSSARVFNLDGAPLTELLPSAPTSMDRFGHSVAISGGTIVVGDWTDGTNGSNSGAAYIYDTPMQTHMIDLFDGR